MAIYYQTEYRLGRRGRIRRSYTGMRAFAAIFLDLIFGLVFETVASAIGLAFRVSALAAHLVLQVAKTGLKILVAALATVAFLATLPFALLHQAVRQVGSLHPAAGRHVDGDSALKPEWVLGREL
jgi:hypothetical protein